jgi:hypothetical protein
MMLADFGFLMFSASIPRGTLEQVAIYAADKATARTNVLNPRNRAASESMKVSKLLSSQI